MRRMNSTTQRLLQFFVHVFAVFWFVWHFFLAVSDQLGGDPVEAIIHFTGITALQVLLLSLIISPLAKWSKQARLMVLRRPLGLYAFFYSFIHILSYLVLEIDLDWLTFVEEVFSRIYISVGIAAFGVLLVLAVTSIPLLRRFCGSLWQILHNWVFIAAVLGVVHFWLSVKSDISEPLFYSAILFVIFIPRISYWKKLVLWKKAAKVNSR